MKKSRIEELTKDYNEMYDNYIRTVDTLLAFSYVLTWDEDRGRFLVDSAVFQGPALTDLKGKKITPDLAVIRGNHIDIIGELKISLPENHDFWKKEFEQVEGYCSPLKGSIGGSSAKEPHHVAVLVPYHLKSIVLDFLKRREKDTLLVVKTPYSAVSFVREVKATDFYIFEKFWQAKGKDEPPLGFDDQVSVPFNKIKEEYGPSVRFIDQKPPNILLAVVIWDNIFSPLPQEYKYTEKRGRVIEISYSVHEITDRLNRLFSFSCILYKYLKNPSKVKGIPTPIKKKWVLEVLNFFKRHKLVQEIEGGKLYKIFYKRLRPSSKEHFIKCLANEDSATSSRQTKLALFEEN